jgi:hypothetical protein
MSFFQNDAESQDFFFYNKMSLSIPTILGCLAYVSPFTEQHGKTLSKSLSISAMQLLSKA